MKRYDVVGEIGVGGMGRVYLASMMGPGGFLKWVAIKRIHPHLVEDESVIRMFLDEARVAARISHPNVATVLELGEDDDGYFIAMEHLHGEPLREIVRRTEDAGTHVPFDVACRIIADSAEGLHAAHELTGVRGEALGVVHRDVTPHNLFVTFEGVTKVVDFGIAKFRSRVASTNVNAIRGKLAYMSPEQAAGESLDRRSDVFSLGVVAWELTTGRRLFRTTDDLETLAKVRDCEIPKPSSLVNDYPAELENVIMRALSRDRKERFATARQLSRALQIMLMRSSSLVSRHDVSGWLHTLMPDRIARQEGHLRAPESVMWTLTDPTLVTVLEKKTCASCS